MEMFGNNPALCPSEIAQFQCCSLEEVDAARQGVHVYGERHGRPYYGAYGHQMIADRIRARRAERAAAAAGAPGYSRLFSEKVDGPPATDRPGTVGPIGPGRSDAVKRELAGILSETMPGATFSAEDADLCAAVLGGIGSPRGPFTPPPAAAAPTRVPVASAAPLPPRSALSPAAVQSYLDDTGRTYSAEERALGAALLPAIFKAR